MFQQWFFWELSFFLLAKKNQINPQESNNQSLIGQLTDISNKYRVDKGNFASKKQPNGGRAVAADAVGAAGGAFGGPLTAFIGAACMSIYDLYQQDAFSKTKAKARTQPSTNPNNPYDNIGAAHNSTVLGYINAYEDLEINSNTEQILKQFVINKAKSDLDPTFDENIVGNYSVINNYNVLFNSYNGDIDGIVENAANAGQITTTEKQILIQYLNTLLELPLTDALSYSIDCESLILNSQNLSQDSKTKLLSSMSVARNSRVLYDMAGIE